MLSHQSRFSPTLSSRCQRLQNPPRVWNKSRGLGTSLEGGPKKTYARHFPDSQAVGGILFREHCLGRGNSLSSAANSVSSAQNSVSSLWHTIIGWKDFTELSPRDSARPKKITDLGVWNRALRNRRGPFLRPSASLRWSGDFCQTLRGLGPEGPKDSCKWRTGSQSLDPFRTL